MDDWYFNRFRKIVQDQFLLNLESDHGVRHWKRVEDVGIYLARKVEADVGLIRLFALLHDSQRYCEGYDPDHGSRAAEYVRRLFKGGVLVLDQSRLDKLIFACHYHNDRKARSDNITINICWDADRIDLQRVGIPRDDIKLTTAVAIYYLQTSRVF